MSRIVGIVLVFLVVFLTLGLILPAIYRARADEEMRRCQNHLRQIGGFALFHSTTPGEPIPAKAQQFLPPGTIFRPGLNPEQRFSWYVLVLPALDRGSAEPELAARKKSLPFADLMKELEIEKPWDAEGNLRLAWTRLTVALCPSQFIGKGADDIARTNYVGNGGIGANTAALSLDEAETNAGAFRYDTRTPLEAIQQGDGLSNTISLLETTREPGAWVSGGPATVRSLDVDGLPFLGTGRPFSGCHRGRGNFALADGSVRVLNDNMNPAVFRALLTIHGGDREVDSNDW